MRTLNNSATCRVETFSLATEEFSDENEEPGRAPRHVPAARAYSSTQEHRWTPRIEDGGVLRIDRSFGQTAMNALARAEVTPTADEIENALIAGIDEGRRDEEGLDEENFTMRFSESEYEPFSAAIRVGEAPPSVEATAEQLELQRLAREIEIAWTRDNRISRPGRRENSRQPCLDRDRETIRPVAA